MYYSLFYTLLSPHIITGEKKKNGTRVNKKFGWFMVFNATFNNISVISWL